MTASANWIHDQKKQEPSLNDKLLILLKNSDKLVLVQKHELERIRNLRHKDSQFEYINQLYQHYIVLGLPKTFIRD